MILSDVSVRRPVFAAVLSLLLVLLGAASFLGLPVREMPDVDPPVVSIETTYRGGSAEVVETKITQLIEDRVAGLEGIEKLTSTSRDERSSIRIEFSLDRDIDAAANDVRDRVARVVADLPLEADPPEIAKVDDDTQAVMYLNVTSDRLSSLEISDYADRFLTDRFSTVPGVARVRISGERRYAMRIWLDRERLAARGLTVADVEDALLAENVELPAGRLESSERELSLRTDTGFESPEQFRRLVVGRGAEGRVVRLGDVADVRVGAANERNAARANGAQALSLGIEPLSKANLLDVSRGVRAEVAAVADDLPGDLRVEVNFDQGDFVRASMREVVKALAFAIGLVLVVMFGFLGTLRATLVPAVVVPASIVSSFLVMAALGFTINTLTLLGLVLAIGLVVDDAIVVLENIYRRIERGQPALLAALEGSKQIGFAVVATTAVLVAVFVPLSFIDGDMGRLFGEFGISLAAAVIFSSVIALSLTPMMCSKLFADASSRRSLADWLDARFQALSARYEGWLAPLVDHWGWTLTGAAAVTAVAVGLSNVLPVEYAPLQDRGGFPVVMRGPDGASFAYTDRHARKIEEVLQSEVDPGPLMRYLTRVPASFGATGDVSNARFVVLLDPWDERDESLVQTQARLRERLGAIPGVRAAVLAPFGLGMRRDGRPVELVVGGPDYDQLLGWRDQLLEVMESLPQLESPDSNYQVSKPQLGVAVDRDRAAVLGVPLAVVGRTLETMLGSRRVTTYVDRGREYDVVLQGENRDRSSPDDLTNLYVRSATTGALVPLANLVSLEERATARELHRFDRMRAVTVDAALAPGVSLGEALDALEGAAREVLPGSARIGWDGAAREFRESRSSLQTTFGLALLIVFLVLAAQFESFLHPVIILVTVPLALAGAVFGLLVFGGSLNVYSQIGAILLIGLAAKNGVLVVEFANQLREQGRGLRDAAVEAAAVRLRPILMTSACTTFGALPLLLATGAGAEAREPIGVVIVFGVSFATLLTLFVVPALYVALAGRTRAPDHVTREIERLRADEGEAAQADGAG